MKRAPSLLIAFVGVLGLIGLTPAAQANHDATKPPGAPHEGPPVPPTPQSVLNRAQNTCSVLATVKIDDQNGTGGLSAIQMSHNHYNFDWVFIPCFGVNDDFNGSMEVYAAGGTDGPASLLDPRAHGETTSAGWSHSSCYSEPSGCAYSPNQPWIGNFYSGTNVNSHTGDDQNFGEVIATIDGVGTSYDTDNWIKFCRGVYDFDGDLNPDCHPSLDGSYVIAWGVLADWWHTGTDLCFYADLVLEPTDFNFHSLDTVTKVNHALVEGEAFTWETSNKDICHGPKKFVK